MASTRNQTVVVRGYQELLRALREADADTKREVRSVFREVGEIVRRDAAERLAKYSTRSAQGLRVRVRLRGVEVEQSLRKTTGKRPDYGSLQMRKALLPSLYNSEEKVQEEMYRAVGRVADRFNRQ